jgi:HEAT repeat protein
MNHRTPIALIFVLMAFASLAASPARADDDTVQTVITLLSDKDKEVRAIGLEQVRDEAKGAEATRRFAALLPKLAPEAQIGLLGALAGRGDAAAKPAVLDLLKSSKGDVRAAAIRAMGPLGDKTDVPPLVALLDDATNQRDAVAALTLLVREGINAALGEQLKSASATAGVEIVKLLVARHAVDSVPALLAASNSKDAKIRAAALDALGQLGGPELITKLAIEIIHAKDEKSREEAETSLALIARRDPKNPDPALPLLKVMDGLRGSDEIDALLSAVGRIGGPSAKERVERALRAYEFHSNKAGLIALCNWPDGTVAPKLAEYAASSADPKNVMADEHNRIIDALIRVAPLPDGRPDAERLAMTKKAMELCSNDSQRTTVIKRARAIRSLDTLRFVAPYMDQPQFAQIACETVVELAHHKELRQPNKTEFGKALDKVILLSKDPEVILRAKHYLKDETWVEKQLKGK